MRFAHEDAEAVADSIMAELSRVKAVNAELLLVLLAIRDRADIARKPLQNTATADALEGIYSIAKSAIARAEGRS